MAWKLTFAAAIVLLVSVYTFSQESCNRPVSEAPAISGLTVGMSFEQVQQALGSVLKTKPLKNVEGTIYLSFAEQSPPKSLRNIGTLWLRLFENRVYQVEVFYSD